MSTRELAFTTSLAALSLCGTVFAADVMQADAVEALLINNTLHGTNLQKDNREFTNYFRDDGTATKLTWKGKKKQGTWRVADDGTHCVDWGDGERCNPVIDLGNGSYQKIENGEPRIEFTVTPGNPEKL
jgi:hypothetical protein